MKLIIVLLFNIFCNNLYAQISITPKLGFELYGFNGKAKGYPKRKDLNIKNPNFSSFVGVEISKTKNKNKISFAIDNKNIGFGFKIFNDSAIVANTLKVASTPDESSASIGIGTLFVGILYDKIKNKFNWSNRITYGYGIGLGINFNRTKYFYDNAQNARYSTYYWRGYNYTWYEIFTKERRNGLLLKLRGSVSLLNRTKRECLIVEAYWNQGFIVMNEETINYKYGTTNLPGSGKTVTGYKFNNRGTTAGVNFGFPIYLSKYKKPLVKSKTTLSKNNK